MKYSLFVAAAIALICSSVSAGVEFSVESRLLDERLASELQKAVKPVYVHTDESVINLRGWVTPQLTLTPLRFQESSSSAIADLSFSGQVAFSRLRLKCLLQDRTVGGRIGFSGTARVMVTGERVSLCCFSVNPEIQCLASDSPFLRFLFKRNAIREAIRKAIQKQATIAALSFVRTANEEFVTLATSLKTQLQQHVPGVTISLMSDRNSASLQISHSTNEETVKVLIGSKDHVGAANDNTAIAVISDEAEFRFSTIQVTEKCLNRLYRIAVGKKMGDTFTTDQIFPRKRAVLHLTDSSPFQFGGSNNQATARMSFISVGEDRDKMMKFTLFPDPDPEIKGDQVLSLKTDIAHVELPMLMTQYLSDTGGTIGGFGDLSAKVDALLSKKPTLSDATRESLERLVKSKSRLLEESFEEASKTISLKFQWTQIKEQPAK